MAITSNASSPKKAVSAKLKVAARDTSLVSVVAAFNHFKLNVDLLQMNVSAVSSTSKPNVEAHANLEKPEPEPEERRLGRTPGRFSIRIASVPNGELAVRRRAVRRSPLMVDVPLPNVPGGRAIWRGQVVPSYIHFVATLDNPWDADSTGEEIDALQQSWSAGFPNHQQVVTAASPMYKVVRLTSSSSILRLIFMIRLCNDYTNGVVQWGKGVLRPSNGCGVSVSLRLKRSVVST